jgi:hypothetical protein
MKTKIKIEREGWDNTEKFAIAFMIFAFGWLTAMFQTLLQKIQ